ncbi:MAG: sugar ABC transporter ATP-binding protein [Spirochaeta sp.]|jgi:ribose transport system ATP-binding protein|nr:sugar ABC transporter ATP-binding protein [Spirochaeta sp.]
MGDTKTQAPLLTVRNLSKRFPGVQALDGVSLDIYPSEVHVLMGENGAGKSTLMKILAGVYHADEGEIQLDGATIAPETPLDAMGLGITLINQELGVATNLTVAENVFMGSEPHKWGVIDRHYMAEKTQEVLDTLGAPFLPETKAATLKVAEQQQVDIARSLVHNSHVLIMDEPTAALSEPEIDKLFDLIKSLRQQGMAIVYISHRLAEVSVIADRVSVLRDGQYIGTVTGQEMDKNTIVSMMVGRSLQDFYDHEVSETKQDRFLVVKEMADGKRVKNVSFQAAAGEILAFSGLVGSGRTELARLIFGADKGVSGEVWVDGKRLTIRSPGDAINQGLGYVPEERKSEGLFLQMSSQENILMNVMQQNARFGILNTSGNDTITARAIEQLNIKVASPRTPAVSLSGGNQQKLLLARWLEIKPRVLILDEPTRGVDVGAKSEIYKLIGEIAKQGVAVVFISSELPEVVGLAQRVLVMREGHIVTDITDPAEINQETIMAYATGVREPDYSFTA